MRYFATRDELIASLDRGLIIAELGVFKGDFSEVILRNAEPALLYLVDTFNGVVECGDKDGLNVQYCDITDEFQRLTDKYKQEAVVVKKCTTREFLQSTLVEAVYIDANHSFDSVYEDLCLSYYAGCRLFMCHDYNLQSVSLAVKQFCYEHKLKIQAMTRDLCPTVLIR